MPGFKLFAVADEGIRTPEVGVLEGVTRKTVVELANGDPRFATPVETTDRVRHHGGPQGDHHDDRSAV